MAFANRHHGWPDPDMSANVGGPESVTAGTWHSYTTTSQDKDRAQEFTDQGQPVGGIVTLDDETFLDPEPPNASTVWEGGWMYNKIGQHPEQWTISGDLIPWDEPPKDFWDLWRFNDRAVITTPTGGPGM